MSEAQTPPPQRSAKTMNKALIVIAAMVVVTGVGFAVWRLRPRGNEGRPVPTPRSSPAEPPGVQSNVEAAANETLTLNHEAAQRAGIRIETVGEQMSAAAGGQTTTGVVQPNIYRETPVVAIVGGIVRRVVPELGQTVRQGQTVAVVFSSDLAEAQAKYLTALAELDEHHKHHLRTEKLVEIGAASR
ncbi:MAG TPA: efflux RND transporter periplasmic adaptor subunit, partial [Pyrinomonadaceae bacterium]|nr:efflux RND transporter periplasmic adaptor subunit [Pyrinomonadaceae bacterium]